MGNGQGELHPAAIGNRRINGTSDYRILPDDNVGGGSLKEKSLANFRAIEVLNAVRKENRQATAEEQQTLVRYVGWGGIPQVFATHEDETWQQERERLRELLTPEEHRSAQASTLNAHYTSPTIVSAIYGAVQRLGFTHGHILEPALGIGHFFGLMPEPMRQQSRLSGVEIDATTASIARLLYPGAHISQQGFEQSRLPDNAFDLAISNVPFGNYKVFDPEFNKHGFLIHDYFFAKALQKTRPGGLIAFITSKGTMDKADRRVRDYMHERAELLGAIRLPNTAFKQNANTEVTTDIIFLRRLENGESPCGHDWRELAKYVNSQGVTFEINRYFAERRHMMCGDMAEEATMYGPGEPALVPDARPLEEALKEAVARLPQGIYRELAISCSDNEVAGEGLPAPEGIKEVGFALHDGHVTARQGNHLVLVEGLSGEASRRIRGLILVRDALREVLRTQLEESGEPAILAARQQLHIRYDHFVSRFGPINALANRRAFRSDPDSPLLCSLEDYRPDSKGAKKAAIFRERTIHASAPVRHADSARDALVVTLNERAKVDLEHMAGLLQKDVTDIMPELKGLIFLNPETRHWETEDNYLFGNVRDKLKLARQAAAADDRFQENVDALQAVQPEDLKPSEIEARLGAAWIPAQDVAAFASSLLGGEKVEVSHAPQVGIWFVRGSNQARSSVANTTEWGIARYSALDLIQDSLNLKTPTVYDKDTVSSNLVVNSVETEGARDRQEKLKERFKTWIWEDDDRRERLCRQYNDQFNSVRLRVFNGSHLTLPGSSLHVSLRPHQKAAVWRIIQSKNTLLAHAVGAGKTFSMVAAGIEMKRLGLATKPMFVVPNHMLTQFSTELLILYPNATILAAGKNDFEAARRAQLFSRIATGNWDAVIVTHSSFEKIPLSTHARKDFISSQIAEIEEVIRDQKSDRSGTRLVKELERVRKRLEVKLEALSADKKKDLTLTFEELGVDRLFIDEAHKFKNLFYVTKMTRVAGLPQTASERAFDLFLKVQHIQRRNDGGGVVFATGTPISNTMAEMFTMQRYLQMASLRRHGLQHFDSWAGTFGETVTAMELSPDGAGYRMQHRFARFVNVPELMQQFRQAADVQTADMLKLPIPKLESGHAIIVSAPCSPMLKKFVEQLVKRAEKVKGGKIDPKKDNMLKITSEGRLAALDIRLAFPGAADAPDSKVNLAVEKIHRIWLESATRNNAQLVFCDLSTPQKGKRGFSVYDDIRDKLVARGIPDEQIAFIQQHDTDAAKDALFKSVRAGRVRVLLGSTLKMGEGTNVQQRLIALHHLDAPWRPSDIEQREGRILRQGNQNEFVSVFRYVTEGSFDAYMWQTLETKARFIAQVMTGDASMRKAEDVDSTALSYAEVKAIASGNPMVMEKAQIDAEVIRLTRLQRQHMDGVHTMRLRIKRTKQLIKETGQLAENLKQDIRTRTPTRGDQFSMTIENQSFDDRLTAGRKMVFIGAALKPLQVTGRIGSIAGFPISMRRLDTRIELRIHGKNNYEATVSESPQGTISSLEHALDGLDKHLQEVNSNLRRHKDQLEALNIQVQSPFEHEDKLSAARNRQQEIIEALDITKNQASVQVDEGAEDQSDTLRKDIQVKRHANKP
ncbi:helicase [Phragmitibacter flavus]|uniref:Helicase n=1 Tax=Phragmitibacter flavus TaxID=2576071 RepID=A0A5R8KG49_9BACT|nr:DEAD/DEAH box helicase family protein [Phragmitibacter flavus]TLD71287.1 helicase [Phragmitibacter flavus]